MKEKRLREATKNRKNRKTNGYINHKENVKLNK